MRVIAGALGALHAVAYIATSPTNVMFREDDSLCSSTSVSQSRLNSRRV
jgi:hypothetical protein